jgi:hypothetical protein
MSRRPSVLLFALGLLLAPSAQWVQQAGERRAQTEHLEITYPSSEEAKVREFLSSAEDVYQAVDSLMYDALPASLRLTFVAEPKRDSTRTGLVLSLLDGSRMTREFALQLTHTAARQIVGPSFDAESYRFVAEGLAAWVGERVVPLPGSVEQRLMLASYAYMEEATYPEYLASYELASEEMGKAVINAAGLSFVTHVVERRGRDGLASLLGAMSDNIEICSALDQAGFGCDSFLDDWEAALEAEAAKHDFSILPTVHADLLASGQGELRDLSLWVRIINPEAADYPFYISLVIDGEELEEPFYADESDYSGLVPLGQVSAGVKVLWDVAVWSETLQLWRRSGWQDRIIE